MMTSDARAKRLTRAPHLPTIPNIFDQCDFNERILVC